MALVQTYSQQFEMQLFLFGQQILAQVAQDNNLDHGAMVKKYLSQPEGGPGSALPVPINNGQNIPAPMLVMASQEKAKKPRKVNPDKVMCKGVTAKGQPCKFAAQTGCEFCKKHSEDGSQKAPKAPKAQKAPEHNHQPGEVPQEICGVCESHGDITKPGLPEEEFKLEEGNIRDKLKQILKEASDSEPEEEPVEEPSVSIASLEEFGMEMKQGELLSKEPEEEEEDEETLKNKLAAILAQEEEDDEDEE
jgi:hypothetical protein